MLDFSLDDCRQVYTKTTAIFNSKSLFKKCLPCANDCLVFLVTSQDIASNTILALLSSQALIHTLLCWLISFGNFKSPVYIYDGHYKGLPFLPKMTTFITPSMCGFRVSNNCRPLSGTVHYCLSSWGCYKVLTKTQKLTLFLACVRQ